MEENEFEFEKILIRTLFSKDGIREKIIPYLSVDIFTDEKNQEIVKEIIDFNSKHNSFPGAKDILLALENDKIKDHFRLIGKMNISDFHRENLLSKIEEFVRGRLVWNELSSAVELLKDKKIQEINAQKIAEAQSFNFDMSIGLDLFEDDGEKFYNDLHDEGVFVKTGLPIFDKMMNGGYRKKTFTLFVAGTNCFDGDEEIEVFIE